jgi:hypothetical protein
MMLMWRSVAAMIVAMALLGGCTGAAGPSPAPPTATPGQLIAPTPPPTRAPTRAPGSATNAAGPALITCDVMTRTDAEALTGKTLVGSFAIDENGFQGCDWVFDIEYTCTQPTCMPVDSRWDLDVLALDRGGRAALQADLASSDSCPAGVTFPCSSPVADLAPDGWQIGYVLEVLRGDRLFKAGFGSYSARNFDVPAALLRKVFVKLGL